MLELIVLFGVAGVCSVACSLSGSGQTEISDAGEPPAADDQAHEYKDLLTDIFADDAQMAAASGNAALTLPQAPPETDLNSDMPDERLDETHDAAVDPLNPSNWIDAATAPVISDYTFQDQLVVGYSPLFQGDTSVQITDVGADAVVSVGGETVAVLENAAGAVSSSDIAVMPNGAFA